MRFQQNPGLKRLLKPLGQIEVRHAVMVPEFIRTSRYFVSRGCPDQQIRGEGFIRSGLAEFKRRKVIHQVQARLYLSPYIGLELLKCAGDDLWREAHIVSK